MPALFAVLIFWGYIYQPFKERPRDIWSVCFGLAMIAITCLAFTQFSYAAERPLYDANGHYAGSVFDYGRTQTFTDQNGQFTGSAVNNGNGTTSFFNRNGNFTGSAGSSIDRAFNLNRR